MGAMLGSRGNDPFRQTDLLEIDSVDFAVYFGGKCPTDLEGVFPIIKQLDIPLWGGDVST
ncbi:hypothetical protein PHLCEN_2v5175 [Hermanssonia centrifuga]|uniref:Uncharacterized protein n=1 Tax=Hermanssonia centrifuga TaxID=98765 RepID=A0A2R6P8S0_9APHY|nr:hypothetical protein PHLCEN_2v5175 [Hermanssonia centrifuga]